MYSEHKLTLNMEYSSKTHNILKIPGNNETWKLSVSLLTPLHSPPPAKNIMGIMANMQHFNLFQIQQME